MAEGGSEACHEFLGFEDAEAAIMSDTVQLAIQTGLEEVDVVSVEKLLHSHGEDLTNEELQELENSMLSRRSKMLLPRRTHLYKT